MEHKQGCLAGSIDLDEENSLSNILGPHPKHVDFKGNIIYRPDMSRINENAEDNEM
ncbi:hypothetical protein [Domibacillus epiphyticus]|uniref:hypothetical protein n=1 Tax=Domibacillus epiphyticus TaxID=1714355 RepID=UPI0013010C9C|nr:hypothetical protein [Domibacillus epiphyticus]